MRGPAKGGHPFHSNDGLAVTPRNGGTWTETGGLGIAAVTPAPRSRSHSPYVAHPPLPSPPIPSRVGHPPKQPRTPNRPTSSTTPGRSERIADGC